jgi:hypothetical protein
LIRSPLDLAGGLFLIAIAVVGYAGTFSLSLGQLSDIGAGMMPKVVAVLVGAFGCILALQSFIVLGDGLARWGVRGPLLLLSAALLFAFAVRPLGLVIAGPLAFLVAALADRSTRFVEAVIAAIVATLFCGLLFKELLSLPIPFDPRDILGFLHGPYDALKVAIKGLVMAISR